MILPENMASFLIYLIYYTHRSWRFLSYLILCIWYDLSIFCWSALCLSFFVSLYLRTAYCMIVFVAYRVPEVLNIQHLHEHHLGPPPCVTIFCSRFLFLSGIIKSSSKPAYYRCESDHLDLKLLPCLPYTLAPCTLSFPTGRVTSGPPEDHTTARDLHVRHHREWSTGPQLLVPVISLIFRTALPEESSFFRAPFPSDLIPWGVGVLGLPVFIICNDSITGPCRNSFFSPAEFNGSWKNISYGYWPL